MSLPQQHDVYLLTGSNQGDRREQLASAITELEQHAGKVLRASRLYETEAWGLEGLPAHLNQALLLQTELAPLPLLETLQQIEHRLGRVRQQRWGVRAIDIDIIYFDNLVLQLPQLVVPHPLMQERNFVLAPLSEIAPGLVHPVLQKTTDALLQQSADKLLVWPYSDRPATTSGC